MCESECVSRRACPVSVSRDVSYLSKIGSNFRSDLLERCYLYIVSSLFHVCYLRRCMHEFATV